jgi:hypothetical protein
MHVADGCDHLLDGLHLFDCKPVREKSLVNQFDHALVIRLQPDGPEMFSVYIHRA